MTEYGAPFDGILTGDATVAPYSADEWARIWKLQQGIGVSFVNYGVFVGTGDGTHQPLEVDATTIISTNVEVQIGAASVNGRFYENTAVVTLAVGANASGNPRIDTVILRLDFLGQTIRLAVKQGTPAGSPVRPTMQQDATYWEIPLADIAVVNGFTTLAQSTISQRQRTIHTQGYGWQPQAYPLNYAPTQAANGSSALTPAQTILVPFPLYANMLLYGLVFDNLVAGGTAYNLGWDIYFQDTNDGNTSENTLRRVAQSDGNLIAVSAGAGVLTLEALGRPVPLVPGLYWVAFQNRHAVNNFTFNVRVENTFEAAQNILQTKVTTNPNGATLDAVTGWAKDGYMVFMRLQGYVFGETTPF